MGEWIELTRASICTGMCEFGTAHRDAAAPIGVTVSFSDRTSQKLTLPDDTKPHEHALKPTTSEWARITIDDVRPGKSYTDACISEAAFD